MSVTFKSKVSVSLVLIILGAFFLNSIICPIDERSLVSIILSGLLLFIVLYVICNIKYVITNNVLTIKYGFFTAKSYNIQEMSHIKNTHTLLSSPAASLDRIAIYFVHQRIPLILSPRNKENFILTLKTINPHIVYEK